jgi:hypothetical protein
VAEAGGKVQLYRHLSDDVGKRYATARELLNWDGGGRFPKTTTAHLTETVAPAW